jgi:hypothetical protein
MLFIFHQLRLWRIIDFKNIVNLSVRHKLIWFFLYIWNFDDVLYFFIITVFYTASALKKIFYWNKFILL